MHQLDQLLLLMTLFRDLPEKTWFATTKFRDRTLSTPVLSFTHV